jgi:hypothetical protein
VQVLEVHGRGVSMANHIIQQDEDTAKFLLYATSFDKQDVVRWLFDEFSCLRKDLS